MKSSNATKPLILKSFSVWNSSMILSFTPMKAQYVQKNDYLALSKPGVLLFDFIPLQETNLKWDQKKTYTLSPKYIGDFLNGRQQLLTTQTEINIEFNQNAQGEFQRNLKFVKSSNSDEIIATINSSKIGQMDQNPYSVKMTIGEFTTIRELAGFALPFLLGWHGLYSTSMIENEVRNY